MEVNAGSKDQYLPDNKPSHVELMEEQTVICDSEASSSNHGGKIVTDPNYSYEGDTLVYTKPNTGEKLWFCTQANDWVPYHSSYQYYQDGDTYCFRDIKHGTEYVWNSGNSKWELKKQGCKRKCEETDKEETHNVGEFSHTYTDPSDGTTYEWDAEKRAWFPKLDEEFLAHYHINYGLNVTTQEQAEKISENKEIGPEDPPKPTTEQKKKQDKQIPTWFDLDETHNTKVYVENLPGDVTEVEFLETMQKCGLVMKDPTKNNSWKIKLYRDKDGRIKGDGICTYIKVESVDLALQILDGYELRGRKLSVHRAKFTMRGKYNPELKPKKRKLKRKEREKQQQKQEKLFDWRPDELPGGRPKHEQVVVLRGLFDPQEFESKPKLILEYQSDVREECIKCGAVRKVVVYDRHPEGVVQVFFKELEAADACVQLMNGRWFGGRKVTAETWDGKSKYRVEEIPEERKKRMEQWNKHLEETKLS